MTPDETREAKAVVLRWLERCWSEGDYAALPEIMAPDATVELLGSGNVRPFGPTQAEAMIRGWRKSFDRYHYTVHALVAEGDTVVALTTFSGVLTGPTTVDGSAVPPQGQRIDVPEVLACRCAGGTLVEVRYVLDSLILRRQLGVLPTP